MSDLAFNLQGERFQVPAAASAWRVRRFKRSSGRGMPEVVFGDDGLPLVVPIDTDIEEFRRLVGGTPGKYRLDPIDDQHQACEGGQAAYVQFHDAAAASAAHGGGSNNDALLRQVIAANTDMMKMIAERFAQVMESAAVLLRAADGAGLPAREPIAQMPSPTPAANDADADDAEDDSGHPITALVSLVKPAMPLVNQLLHTKVFGLTPEQSAALLGAPTPSPAAPTTPPAASPAAPAARTEPTSGAAPAPASSQAPGSSPEPSPADDDPQRFVTLLNAVQQRLAPSEMAFVTRAIQNMTPETLASWRKRLLAMSPDGAVAAIRAELAKGGTSDDR